VCRRRPGTATRLIAGSGSGIGGAPSQSVEPAAYVAADAGAISRLPAGMCRRRLIPIHGEGGFTVRAGQQIGLAIVGEAYSPTVLQRVDRSFIR
jgi:hypothetical protein